MENKLSKLTNISRCVVICLINPEGTLLMSISLMLYLLHIYSYFIHVFIQAKISRVSSLESESSSESVHM